MLVSIIIPVYNEKGTIEKLINAVKKAPLEGIKEVIVIDDGSTDGTREILKEVPGIQLVLRARNGGKGSALRDGFKLAKGDYIIIQDADLEYDPQDYPKLLQPLIKGRADVVYGSRFIGSDAHRTLFFWHYLGNKTLTVLSNLFTNLNLTDMETGYKAFTKPALHKILPQLTAKRFGIEPEITARVAQNKLRIYEIGISYNGRTYEEGKKITWRDGAAAIWHIIKYNVFRA